MTNISTIFDAYIEMIETVLPEYKRIENPYDLEKASNLILRKGYAVGFDSAINDERLMGCQISITRNFFVILTNQLIAKENDGAAKAELEKAILEDQFLLIKAIEQDPTLNDGGSALSKYLNDDGIQFLESNKAKYLVLEMRFSSAYFENLNP